ncbi:MAG: ImmA/IrrE family metallo-endopeptidase [Propionibacteriaceae bacterium]|nr:ImmA/IrrE family metallo-endopeptidase [Propionibacteriaceae bacterium]
MRSYLGNDLSGDLADRCNERLNVDVVVVDLAGDGYTLQVGGHFVIVVSKTGSWFRQNFSIAHELAHVAQGTMSDQIVNAEDPSETAANAFAAELLMPESQIRSLNWVDIELPVLAQHVWQWGVSTKSLAVRLQSLHMTPASGVMAALQATTQAFLRAYWAMPPGPDLITRRMERSAQRRFPTSLMSDLEAAVVAGRAPLASLAFTLGVDENQLEIEPSSLADPARDISFLDGLV